MRLLFLICALLCASLASAATVYITEYSGGTYTPYQAAVTPLLANQTVAISGSSVQSTAFNASTRLIRVHADSICSIEIGGASPTATTSSARFIAGQTEYFQVVPGQKLAVITNN